MRLGPLLALAGAIGSFASSPSATPVHWRLLGAGRSTTLPAAAIAAASFTGTAAGAEQPVAWRVTVLSSRSDLTRAQAVSSPPMRSALVHAGTITSFAYRRLVVIAVASPGGCCPLGIDSISTASGALQVALRRPGCASPCAGTGAAARFLVVSVPRGAFTVPTKVSLRLEPPPAAPPAPAPACPDGYSYAGFVSSPAADLTASLTLGRLPDLVTANDHALAYASIVARDAQQIPRAWLQAGIGRGAIGTYPDDGRAWVYVEAQTAAGYQLNEIAPAAVGVPVGISFSGGGSTWVVAVDGKEALSADLGTPATGTSTAVEVYRATTGGACPSVDFTLSGVAPKGDRRGLLPLLDESSTGWRVVLG